MIAPVAGHTLNDRSTPLPTLTIFSQGCSEDGCTCGMGFSASTSNSCSAHQKTRHWITTGNEASTYAYAHIQTHSTHAGTYLSESRSDHYFVALLLLELHGQPSLLCMVHPHPRILPQHSRLQHQSSPVHAVDREKPETTKRRIKKRALRPRQLNDYERTVRCYVVTSKAMAG